MSASSIEWTDRTWNPVVGCTRVSPGCEHCYAEIMAARLVLMSEAQGRPSVYLRVVDAQRRRWTRPKDAQRDPVAHRHVELLPERLAEPLSFRPGTRVFVCSMSDLFHADVPFDYIAQVFGVMAATPGVTYQVLTKRPKRMREFFAHRFGGLEDCAQTVAREAAHHGIVWDARGDVAHLYPCKMTQQELKKRRAWRWPLPNVWLGTSVEDQDRADARIPELLRCPAAIRFISAEPLLGPLRLYHVAQSREGGVAGPATFRWIDALRGGEVTQVDDGGPAVSLGGGPRLDLVIVGGESGPGARDCRTSWIGDVLEQCLAAGTAAFNKQLGARPVWDRRVELDMRVNAVGGLVDRKGGDMSEWPRDLQVRQLPEARRG